MLLLLPILLYLTYVNIAAYRAFVADKQYAIDKAQRTPETELLRLALIGGWIGAKFAQHRLRHKSYKQPFGSQLNIIGMVHATSVILFALIMSVLALLSTDSPVSQPTQTAMAAQPDVPPADGPPKISLRPPVGRPATL
tara:strand:+ start:185 stop:601 length:417 start_codon:yes stop_codon:yes gene_type:complete